MCESRPSFKAPQKRGARVIDYVMLTVVLSVLAVVGMSAFTGSIANTFEMIGEGLKLIR